MATIINMSDIAWWIAGAGKKWFLKPGKSSATLKIDDGDADGLLLPNNIPVFFRVSDLLPDLLIRQFGGNQLQRTGAIKVSELGELIVSGGVSLPGPVGPGLPGPPSYVASINGLGLVPDPRPGKELPGWHDEDWCVQQKGGWDFKQAPVGNPQELN